MTATETETETDQNFYDQAYYYAGNKAYRNYDAQNPPYKIRYYTHVMKNAMAGVDYPRVLDVGCAMGYVLQALPKTWHKSGIDASAYAIEIAQKSIPNGKLAQSLSIDPNCKYDIITAFDVIEHIKDYDTMLGSIANGLTPDGKCVLVLPVFDGIFGAIYQKLDYDPTHHNKWSRWRWLETLQNHFEVESWTGIFRYLTPLGYAHFPTRLLRECAPAIIVTLKKRP